MTRLAVLSDVHGNLLALEAVLADVAAQGVPDATWVLGDLAAFCPWPLDWLTDLTFGRRFRQPQVAPDSALIRTENQ
ncbi:MAG: metallophosphoesterase [Anaerolineae bacterium]